MSGLCVVAPGLLTTVQDLGRPGFAAHGVSASGAADALALRLGNRLVGNADGAAALEMTLVGGTFRFDADGVAALAGAETGARLDGRSVSAWTSFPFRAGATLACGPLVGGARTYLCVRGGFDVPLVMGSASTHLVTGLGGLEGRGLRSGDRLAILAPSRRAPFAGTIDPSGVPGYGRGEPFRVTEGPQASWFAAGAFDILLDEVWTVSESCDRMGIGLAGPGLRVKEPRELLTEGVGVGAIQSPSGGSPIVLFVEHQTTGGYPKIANVVSADLARLGTLRPRNAIRFERISIARAHALLRAQEEALDALFA